MVTIKGAIVTANIRAFDFHFTRHECHDTSKQFEIGGSRFLFRE
jgi:hypothetical protein